jgi:hypothetical protein
VGELCPIPWIVEKGEIGATECDASPPPSAAPREEGCGCRIAAERAWQQSLLLAFALALAAAMLRRLRRP